MRKSRQRSSTPGDSCRCLGGAAAHFNAGLGSTVTTGIFATNGADIYGEIGAGGEIAIPDLSASDSGSFTLGATLDYDRRSGSPPTANILLEDSVVAPSAAGLPVSSIPESSWDPDNDLDYKLWIVDGFQRGTSEVIPPGAHTIRLEVEDSRYAFDVDEREVTITYP